jgi:hypothetical protein
VFTVPRNFCAMAPLTVSVPSGLPQSAMKEWFRARIAASIVIDPGPPLLVQLSPVPKVTGW